MYLKGYMTKSWLKNLSFFNTESNIGMKMIFLKTKCGGKIIIMLSKIPNIGMSVSIAILEKPHFST
jgi:hypothetical protein